MDASLGGLMDASPWTYLRQYLRQFLALVCHGVPKYGGI